MQCQLQHTHTQTKPTTTKTTNRRRQLCPVSQFKQKAFGTDVETNRARHLLRMITF